MFKYIILLYSISSSFNLQSQIISTIAGCGDSCTCICDGGLAINGYLSNPANGIFDKHGNFYFVEDVSNCIKKISNAGIITTFAGNGLSGYSGDGGLAINASIWSPVSLVIDTNDNLYITENSNHVIRKVNINSGIISIYAGTGISGYSGDGFQASLAQFIDPYFLSIDTKENIYITDPENHNIRKINSSGIISTIAGNGTMGFSGDNGQATKAQLDWPSGITVDDIGNVFFADPGSYSSRVRKIDTFGVICTVVGNGNPNYNYDEIPALNASINPLSLKIDNFGNLFISDIYNNRIYMVDVSGMLHLLVGNGIAGFNGDNIDTKLASLNHPWGITVDSCNNVYICDSWNHRIRKITYPHCNYLEAENLEKEANGLSIYPNPAFDVLNIKYNKIIKDIIISNITGQKIYEKQNIGANSTAIDISYIKSGLYVIKVDENQWQKWIKE